MTITINKNYLFLALLVALAVFYAVNVFAINKVTNLLVDKPVKLSFLVVSPDTQQCDKCFDAQNIVSRIDFSHNIKISKNKTITPENSSYGKLIKQYAIKNLPAVIISGDIENERILGSWKSLKGEKVGESIVIQNLLPYYNLVDKKTKGIVDVVVLSDNTCEKCFDGNQYATIVKRLGMKINSFNIYDIASTDGANLVVKYKVKKVPALILSSGASDYPDFSVSWEEVGTKEKDGMFVLRKVEKLSSAFKEI